MEYIDARKVDKKVVKLLIKYHKQRSDDKMRVLVTENSISFISPYGILSFMDVENEKTGLYELVDYSGTVLTLETYHNENFVSIVNNMYESTNQRMITVSLNEIDNMIYLNHSLIQEHDKFISMDFFPILKAFSTVIYTDSEKTMFKAVNDRYLFVARFIDYDIEAMKQLSK